MLQFNKREPNALRILQVVGGLDRGGIETWLVRMMNSIDRSRYQIDFLVNSDREYPYSAELIRLGARIIPCLNHRHPWQYWRHFKDAYREHGPYDIVHSQVHFHGGLVLSYAKALHVPIRIAHIHPINDVEKNNAFRAFYRASMLRGIAMSATHVLGCSETTLATFVGQCPLRGQPRTVLYNGIDLAPFATTIAKEQVRERYGLPVSGPIAVYVARFVPHKNHDLILRLAEGFSSEETAQILGITPEAVRMRLSRARQMFRSAYEADEVAGVP